MGRISPKTAPQKPIRRGHHVLTRGFKAMITLNSRCRDAADTEENEASHVKLVGASVVDADYSLVEPYLQTAET